MDFQNDDATVHYNVQDYLNVAKHPGQRSRTVLPEAPVHRRVEEIDLTTSDDESQNALPAVTIHNSSKNKVEQSSIRIIKCRTLTQPTANTQPSDTNACTPKTKTVSFNLPKNETENDIPQNNKVKKFDAKRNQGFIGTKVEQAAETIKDTKKIIVSKAKKRGRPKKIQDTTATKTSNTQFKKPNEKKRRKQTAITNKTTNEYNKTAPIENNSTISSRQQITAGDNITTSYRQLTKFVDNNSSLNVSLIINSKTVTGLKPKRAYNKRTPKERTTTQKQPRISQKKMTDNNKTPKTKDTKKTTAKKPQNEENKEVPKPKKRVKDRKKKETGVNINIKKNTLNCKKESKKTVSSDTLNKIRELNGFKIKLNDKNKSESIHDKPPEVHKSRVVKAINNHEKNLQRQSSGVMLPNPQNQTYSAISTSHALQQQLIPQAPAAPSLDLKALFLQASAAPSLNSRASFPKAPTAPSLNPRATFLQPPTVPSLDPTASFAKVPVLPSLAQRSPFPQAPNALASALLASTLFSQSRLTSYPQAPTAASLVQRLAFPQAPVSLASTLQESRIFRVWQHYR